MIERRSSSDGRAATRPNRRVRHSSAAPGACGRRPSTRSPRCGRTPPIPPPRRYSISPPATCGRSRSAEAEPGGGWRPAARELRDRRPQWLGVLCFVVGNPKSRFAHQGVRPIKDAKPAGRQQPGGGLRPDPCRQDRDEPENSAGAAPSGTSTRSSSSSPHQGTPATRSTRDRRRRRSIRRADREVGNVIDPLIDLGIICRATPMRPSPPSTVRAQDVDQVITCHQFHRIPTTGSPRRSSCSEHVIRKFTTTADRAEGAPGGDPACT